jgi:hypothetical protein
MFGERFEIVVGLGGEFLGFNLWSSFFVIADLRSLF